MKIKISLVMIAIFLSGCSVFRLKNANSLIEIVPDSCTLIMFFVDTLIDDVGICAFYDRKTSKIRGNFKIMPYEFVKFTKEMDQFIWHKDIDGPSSYFIVGKLN